MRLQDALIFRDDLYFEGAVQADWFYQPERAKAVSSSFVFHGPNTHAVTKGEVGGKGLIDTASFALKIAEKADGTDHGSPFTLAIAGYGTGKSHLAVALSTLLSGEALQPDLHARVLENVARADKSIAQQLEKHVRRPRLVLTLNGMRDYNLHYELLRTAEKSLKLNNSPIDVLAHLNKAREIAETFIGNTYTLLLEKFELAAANHGIHAQGDILRELLISQLDNTKSEGFAIVNEVYTAFNGHSIRMDEGVSASAVLETLLHSCCGAHGQFDSIVILFDEFGRYLEYVGANPAAAGDSALQQMFEAVQNAQGDIQFIGFIQSDIKSYLHRVDKTSNISRYIDRFDASEKVYLSSNLETIFANLLEQKDRELYKRAITVRFEANTKHWKEFHTRLSSWLPLQGIWSQWDDFSRVILYAIYPLHPLSTYLLCRLTDWLQNRSSLTLLSEQLKILQSVELSDNSPLPMIYPVDLLQGAFFDELLSAEEQGRQRSQFSILLNNILRKFESKLSDAEQRVLFANLILRVCRFRFAKREDLYLAISECTNLSSIQVQSAIRLLEEEYAVLSYDDRLICFDFVADSVGATDFRNFLRAAKNHQVFNPGMLQQEEVQQYANVIDPISTTFSNDIGATTSEWSFTQSILPIEAIDAGWLEAQVKALYGCSEPNVPKGALVWVYAPRETSNDQLTQLQQLTASIPADIAIRLFLLDDAENKLRDALIEYRVLSSMSAEDKGRFHRFYTDALVKAQERITAQFADMKQERKAVTAEAIVPISERLSIALTGTFKKVYPAALPFDFDGFQNKSIAKASKQFCAMLKWMLLEHMKYQALKSQPVDVRNRIDTLMGRKGLHSWRAVNDDYSGIVPMHERVRAVYNKLVDQLQKQRALPFAKIIPTLNKAPFGMNDYSVFFMLCLLMENMSYTAKVELNGTRYNVENWAETVLSDKKIDMRQLGQTTLILIDAAEAENRFRTLFRQINNNIDMTLVASFQEQLDALEKEESIPETLESDAALARIRLQEGAQAMAAYELLTNEISNNLFDANKKHDSYEAIKGLSKALQAAKRPASSNGAYSYNGDQIKELRALVVRGKAIAEKYFPEWIPQQRCESVSQLSTYEKHIKKLLETLSKFGYREQARQLKTLADQEIDNIRIVAERESLRENCTIFLQTSLITKGLTPAALESLQSRAEEFLRVFDGFNYKQVPQLSKLHDNLVNRLQEIMDAIDEHLAQIEKVNEEIRSLTSIDDVTAAIQRLAALLEGGLTADERADLSESYNFLCNFKQDTAALSSCGNDPIRLNAVYDALVTSYPADNAINLQIVIDSLYAAQSEIICRKAEEWKTQHLSIQPQKMDELALDAWKRSTQPLPAYLDENGRMQHAALLSQVETVLSERRVSYIVMLYEKLDDNEKRMCRSQMGIT